MTNTTNENREYLEAVSQEIKDAYDGGNMIDYVCNNVLDVEHILNSSGELIGVELYIAIGGPTVWIDTRSQTINIAWASECDTIDTYSDICNELNYIFDENFNL